jgi:tetratricopeptide (TPR) repeat protein
MEEDLKPAFDSSQIKGLQFIDWNYKKALLAILFLCLLSYLPIWKNGFVNWDDDLYIVENPIIFSIHLKDIFTANVIGNYHPFTVLVLAIEYKLFGLNPMGFHGVSLLLHLCNTLLVFFCIRKLNGNTTVALVASLLFGIHPVHVESVAWASELKDVLYSFFFLASYLFYLKYMDSSRTKHYIISIVLFIASLLSKGMAVTLPLVIVLTDYYKGKKFSRSGLLEKIPFFLLAVLFGIIALAFQKSANALPGSSFASFEQRIIFAFYSFIMYLYQLILPVNLSIFYPYPERTGGHIPFVYYLYIIPLAALIGFVYYSLRLSKKILFGIGFFTFTIIHVLKLVPVGDAIMADRYNYIPSIGIFFLAGEGFHQLWLRKKASIGISLLLAFAFFFCAQTFSRSKVWNNPMSLWNDVISKYQNVVWAYNNRGVIYLKEKKYEAAVVDFNKAISLNPTYPASYNNRGIVYMQTNKRDSAVADFQQALSLDKNYFKAYTNLGDIYHDKGENDKALQYYSLASGLNPDYYPIFSNRANIYAEQKKYVKAIADLSRVIELNQTYYLAYFNRADMYKALKQYDLAEKDYTHVITVLPNEVLAYNSRGVLYMEANKYDEALNDLNKTIALDSGFADGFYNRGNLYRFENKYDSAELDYSHAIKINPKHIKAYNNRGTLYMNEKKYDAAIEDYLTAMNLDSLQSNGKVAGKDSSARIENKDSVDLYENYARTCDMRGSFYTNARKYDLALKDYNEALRIKPGFAQAYYNRGVLYEQKKDDIAALRDYSSAIKIQPGFAEAYYNRGVVEYRQQKKEDGCNDFRKSAELGYAKARETLLQFCN